VNIIRRYTCETARGIVRYYAVVETDDGQRVELGSKEPLADAEWFSLAETTLAEPAKQEPTVEVEAEDGTII
jgi:hypothetical protein